MKIYEIKKAALAAVDEEYDQHSKSTGDPTLDEAVKNAVSTGYIIMSTLVEMPEGTASYDFNGSVAQLPSDCISVLSLRHASSKKTLTPNIDYIIQNKNIDIINSKFADQPLSLSYVMTNTLLTDDNSTLNIKDYFQNILLQYVIYECLMFKKRESAAKIRLDLFYNMLEPYRKDKKQGEKK